MKTRLLLMVIVMVAAPALLCHAQTAVATATATAPEGTAPDTNAVTGEEPLKSIGFDELALPDAVRQLARLGGLNIEFDPKLLNQVTPDGRPVPPPVVSETWKNVTAMQALNALLDNYGWQLDRDPKTPIGRVTAKNPNALEPLITKVIQLNYSEPTNIAGLVKLTLTDARSSINSDLRTHQIILRTTAKELPDAEALITKLDSATRQVLIEAKIVETTKNINSAKGIDWTGTLAAQHISFGNGLTAGTVNSGSTTGTGLLGTNSLPGGRSSGGAGGVSTIVSNSSSFVTTITGNTAQAGGLSMNTAQGFSPATAFLNADGLSAVLSFLNSDADTKSISFPRTVSLDGVSNELYVVQNVPIFEQQQSSGAPGTANLATVQPNYSKTVNGVLLSEVGVKLSVTPRIAGPTNVLLTLIPEISKVDTLKATDTLNGQVNTSPIFDRRTIITSASVPSGYTLVLGGLDSDNMAKTSTKVPILGDAPLVGGLFRSNTKDHTRDSILIFVTPTIITDADFQPSTGHFLTSQNEDIQPTKDSAWDSAAPYDWTKPKTAVQPAYQP